MKTKTIQPKEVSSPVKPLKSLRRKFREGDEIPTELIACRVTPKLCLHIGVMAAARNVPRGTLLSDILSFVINNNEILEKFEEYSKPLIKVS